MAAEFAPKPGSGVRPLFHYYRQLRPMPAREALEMARYHARMFDESDLFEPRTAGVRVPDEAQERAAFEAWMVTQLGGPPTSDGGSGYAIHEVRWAWMAWKAARGVQEVKRG